MPVIGIKELKTRASLVLRTLQQRRVKGYIITHRGLPVARLTPIEEDELEDLILSMDNPKFRVFLEEARKEPSVPWKELIAEVKRGKVSTRSKKAG